MSQQSEKKGKAPGWRPEAQKNVNLKRNYLSGGVPSRRNSLEQAGEALLRICQAPSLPKTGCDLWQLLERRLRRAYGGRDND